MFKIDIHTHTVASGHAYSTVIEMVKAAKASGLEYLGFSDHSPGMPGSAYIYHFQNMRVIPREIDGVRLLRGVEANIVDYSGKIDMNSDNLSQLDYCIASIHPPCMAVGSVKENTAAMIGAIKNPLVNVIGHPDDARYVVDYEEVVKAAKDYNTLLEVNNSSLNPAGYRKNARDKVEAYLELSEKYNHPVILGSDAHIAYDVANWTYIYPLLTDISFDKSLIVNNDYNKLKDFLNNNPF